MNDKHYVIIDPINNDIDGSALLGSLFSIYNKNWDLCKGLVKNLEQNQIDSVFSGSKEECDKLGEILKRRGVPFYISDKDV